MNWLAAKMRRAHKLRTICMFRNIFHWRAKTASQKTPARTPENKIAYVIGDVHGCITQLKELLSKIEHHASEQDYNNCVIIFLGDLIDRGPHSNEVVSFLMTYRPEFTETVYLMGNHEEIFLQTLTGDTPRIEAWFSHGGQDCARSYGTTNLGQVYTHPDQVLKRFKNKVPKSHIEFLESFQDYYIFGDYLCVHAGIKPGVPLDKQSSRDFRWIRKEFLGFKKLHPYKVIHGHSIVETPEIHDNRIAIDTGAYKGGALTAICLQDDKVSFLQSSTELT